MHSYLKMLRKSAGLSETAASLYIGISRDDLRLYEDGMKIPDPDARHAIMDFYSGINPRLEPSEIFPEVQSRYIQLGDDAENIPDSSPADPGHLEAYTVSFRDAAGYAFSILDERSRKVMSMYYGAGGYEAMKPAGIGRSLGITDVMVNVIRRRAIEKIKESGAKEVLRQFLE